MGGKYVWEQVQCTAATAFSSTRLASCLTCATTHVSDNKDVFERNVERVWKAWKRPWPVRIVRLCTQSVTSKGVDRVSSYPQSRTDLSEVRGFLMNSVLEARAENWVEGCLGNLGQGSGLGLRVALVTYG